MNIAKISTQCKQPTNKHQEDTREIWWVRFQQQPVEWKNWMHEKTLQILLPRLCG